MLQALFKYTKIASEKTENISKFSEKRFEITKLAENVLILKEKNLYTFPCYNCEKGGMFLHLPNCTTPKPQNPEI